ncbi:filament-like plant protein 6-like [Dorcoceras hygrometricum]|uniref:Filament-like plant protein 6-like n=1 Tax=Dorcoceras hygrometricum TaxID=472368 RepID=A0A2Z7AES6_9LAMI|nr:filament-like plant protein 6-like [Dorcoceras hygrometricum]
MDKRSWPWKKKSWDKLAVEKAAAESSALRSVIGATQSNKDKQDNNKKLKYVQISIESYTHLTGLEDQVKSLEGKVKALDDEVKELNEQLSDAQTDITDKENLVKQHVKVAEEAVSGWEKAEAEAATLKTHLESVTLLKLTAEDRATHLDGALKECMRQIRNLKEEHDKKLNEVTLSKAKLFDKMKLELEAKIANLDQELLTSAAENAALSRSLQERSNILIKLSEEKSQAVDEIEHLKSKIESCEKEVRSLNYELHIARKEVDIRNEEKNMTLRSAEVANKQHLEGVKKIAKLEAECQRLRGLVRKKLPGPAAVAQMKLEVENMGRDFGESFMRRSPVKSHSPHFSQLPDFSFDNARMYHKENELLTERLLAMEEETKMLKEALSKRNSELQASRSLCAQTSSELQSLESQLLHDGEQKSTRSMNAQAPSGSFCDRKSGNPWSFTFMSEDGNDDIVSCTDSWAPSLSTKQCHLEKGDDAGGPRKSENTNHLDLMDDFLEMEKIACLPTESNGIDSSTNISGRAVNVSHSRCGKQHVTQALLSPKDDATRANSQLQADSLIFVKLQSQIYMVLESLSKENEMEKIVEDVRCIMQDMLETLNRKSMSGLSTGDGNSCIDTVQTANQKLQTALSQIYDFVIFLGNEAKIVPGTYPDGGLNQKLDEFSAKYGEAISSQINLIDFVLDVSHVLNRASELRFNILGFTNNEVETGSSDCIDKIALPENKAAATSSGERYPNGSANFSDSPSDPDVPHDGNLVPTSESTAKSWKCSSEEFQQLKFDKDSLAADLSECKENFERMKSKLQETERQLSEIKSHFSSAQKSNGLAETQLKCMAESYKSLETRAEELQTEVNLLREKIECLDIELQEEKKGHQEALAKCKDLQGQLERIKSSPSADNGDNTAQEKDLAAAAEKLAECQETIFLLGKQLQAFRPQTEIASPARDERTQRFEVPTDDGPSISGTASEMDSVTCFNTRNKGKESPSDQFGNTLNPSDSEATNPQRSPSSSANSKHRPSKSGSSSTPTPEKQGRVFSRFFSAKEKMAANASIYF